MSLIENRMNVTAFTTCALKANQMLPTEIMMRAMYYDLAL